MKLILMTMLTVLAFEASAVSLRDILPIIIGQNGLQPAPYPGNPGRPGPYPGPPPGRPGYPGRPPGNPYPGNPYPGNPYPGNPYPGNPGPGVTCRADDRGWEEHSGGHYSCGECLRHHGECIETCSSTMHECRVDGYDRYGRLVSFTGRGYDQWRAQDDAMYSCRYNNASNCYVVNCQQFQGQTTRRDCRY